MTDNDTVRRKIRTLITDQPLAVLATQSTAGPYANLVAFAATDALDAVYFATARTTQKYQNLSSTADAAILVDSRTNREADFHEAVAVTAVGPVVETPEAERNAALDLYLARHPYLKDFVRSPTCALMRLAVKRYIFVERFQDVVILEVSHEPDNTAQRD